MRSAERETGDQMSRIPVVAASSAFPATRWPKRTSRRIQGRCWWTGSIALPFIFSALVASGSPSLSPAPAATPGSIRPDVALVVNGGTERSISLLDAATATVSGPFLAGSVGPPGSELLDSVVTSDGKTAVLSNYTDNSLYVIDLQSGTPSLKGRIALPISPQDLALSPDGRFVVVTGGSAAADVVTVEIAGMRLASRFTLVGGGTPSAVAVAPDGLTVLVCSYLSSQLHVLRFEPDGSLTHQKILPLAGRPSNVVISPNGKSVIVSLYTTPDGRNLSDSVEFLVIESPLNVIPHETITDLPGGQQGAQYTPDGSKVLVLSTAPSPDQITVLYDFESKGVVDRGERLNLFSNSPAFLGIDVIATSPNGTRAFVGNPGSATVASRIAVIDLSGAPAQVLGSIPAAVPYSIAFPGSN